MIQGGRFREVAPEVAEIGIGIDTARYGHAVVFLRDEAQPAAAELQIRENRAGYDELRRRLDEVRARFPHARLRVRIDAAGPYARNLEGFLRGLPLELSVSVGDPLRNRHYREVHKPKEKSDRAEAYAMARYALKERPQPSFFPGREFAELQGATSRLQGGTKDLTRAINRLHNLLANVFPELAVLQKDLSSAWVLELLEKWPTPALLVQAGLARLQKIAYLNDEKAAAVLAAARTTIASVQGAVAEKLVRLLVGEVSHLQQTKKFLESLVIQAYRDLPPGNYHQLATIMGIGDITAAVLTAKIVAIERFETPEKLVGYFGVFPQENSSGVDRDGQPHASGQRRMSRQGNDLVRGYLWMAARSAITHNPAVQAQYARLRSNGRRGDVALGHAMQKLLHQVWAIWRTGEAFDGERHLRRAPPLPAHAPPEAVPARDELQKTAAGPTRESSPPLPEVTAATATVGAVTPTVNAAPPTVSRSLDFAHVRSQLRIEQVLELLDHRHPLTVEGPQLRGPCPFHTSRQRRPRHFSVNLEKQVFKCFAPECLAQGNALDLYAQAKRLSIHEAAWQLVEILHLQPTANRERNP